MEFRPHAAELTALWRRRAYPIRNISASRTRLPARHADACRSLWAQSGFCSRSLITIRCLTFAGWRPVDDTERQTIAIWSKDGVPPATPLNAPQIPPRWQGLMWGILSLRQQPAGDCRCAHSRKETAGSASRQMPVAQSNLLPWEDGVVNKGGGSAGCLIGRGYCRR